MPAQRIPKVTFVDSFASFMLCGDTVNDGYLKADRIDITKPAMKKLATNKEQC